MTPLTKQRVLRYIAEHDDELWESAGFPAPSTIPEYLAGPYIWCNWCGEYHTDPHVFYAVDRRNDATFRFCKKSKRQQRATQKADKVFRGSSAV